MYRWLDQYLKLAVVVLQAFFDDLINFWKYFIKNKIADGGHLEKIQWQSLQILISYLFEKVIF